MENAGFSDYTVTLSPETTAGIEFLDAVSVTVTTNYDDVAWLPGSWFMGGRTLTATCIMPADTGNIFQDTSSSDSYSTSDSSSSSSNDDDDDDDDD